MAGESCPDSDKLPRHLPDKVSSTSSSSGAGPRRKAGGGSHPQLPLFSGISAPTSPSRAGPGRYPRPAPPRPAAAASSRPRGACAGVPATLLRATEGSGGSGRGDARSEPVGASLAPQSQQQTALGRTDARARGGKDPWRGSSAPPVPRPTPGRTDLDQQRDQLRAAKPPGWASRGRAAAPDLRGCQTWGGGDEYWVRGALWRLGENIDWPLSQGQLIHHLSCNTLLASTPASLWLRALQISAGREGTRAKGYRLRLKSPWEGGLRCACSLANRGITLS